MRDLQHPIACGLHDLAMPAEHVQPLHSLQQFEVKGGNHSCPGLRGTGQKPFKPSLRHEHVVVEEGRVLAGNEGQGRLTGLVWRQVTFVAEKPEPPFLAEAPEFIPDFGR